MKPWKKNKTASNYGKKEKTKKNNRANFLLAIIFLLAGGVLYKLYYLQVVRCDYYAALAAGQHEVVKELEPSRGRIFVEDITADGGKDLYPIATNKDLALLFVKPAEIPVNWTTEMARVFYDLFDRARDQREVEYLLLKYKKPLDARTINGEKTEEDELAGGENKNAANANEEWLPEEIIQAKRESELMAREEKGVAAYEKILSKENDPYEPIRKKVEDEELKKAYLAVAGIQGQKLEASELTVKNNKVYVTKKGKEVEMILPGIGQSTESYRFYPEGNISSHILGFVGYEGEKKRGRYGIEEYFNEELSGRPGSLKTERDAAGELIIINDREYLKPESGADLILTLDRNVQFAACQKLNAAVKRHGADGGTVIILEPRTGAVLAMCSAPDYDPNNYKEVSDINIYNNTGIFDQYEPGSIFKVITMAMALDKEKVSPDSTYTDTGVVKIGRYEIRNSDLKAHGVSTMTKVLEESLNTGVIHAMRQIGPEVFTDYAKRFGFGEQTGIELEGESKGDIRNLSLKDNRELYAATASFGQGISVTPLQMVMSYAVIANGGQLVKPYIVKEIIQSNGGRVAVKPSVIDRVISAKASTLIGGMMVNVVENGHGKKAGVKGYWVGGKTGTAQVAKKDGRGYEGNSHVGSFAGFAPVDDPKFVMIVKIDHPRDVEWAESSAAPLFGEIAEYILHYYKVPAVREVK